MVRGLRCNVLWGAPGGAAGVICVNSLSDAASNTSCNSWVLVAMAFLGNSISRSGIGAASAGSSGSARVSSVPSPVSLSGSAKENSVRLRGASIHGVDTANMGGFLYQG